MTFSVLINNYNYARFLPETLAGVAAQTLAPHEIIVVDDGSKDDSLAVLESLRATIPRLRVHPQPNGGQLAALRAGVRLASGDWCAFLDADDTWTPEHLAEAAEALSAAEGADYYFSGHQETGGPPIYRSKWHAGLIGPCPALVATTGVRIGTICSTLIVKRELAAVALDLDESFDPEWRIRADDCLLFGAALVGAVALHRPVPTVSYRIHGGNGFARSRPAGDHDAYLAAKARLFRHHTTRTALDLDDPARALADEFSRLAAPAPLLRRRYRSAIIAARAPLPRRLFNLLRTLPPLGKSAAHQVSKSAFSRSGD